MRIFLSLVILFAAAIGLAVGARFNPGNVVLFYPPYRVDLSLNLFVVLAFLAVNSTYRGPYTPGSATCLAFALAVPDDTTAMMTKLKGGIGALTEHLRGLFISHGGELRFRTKVEQILVERGSVTGVRLRDGSTLSAPITPMR